MGKTPLRNLLKVVDIVGSFNREMRSRDIVIDMEKPENSTRMMWVLVTIILSIAVIRGDITLQWFGIGA